MTRPFGMPETPKGRKGWKQNSNGKPNNWALNWSPSNSRLHNDPIQRGGVPWKPQAITLKCPAQGQMSVMSIFRQLTLKPYQSLACVPQLRLRGCRVVQNV